ncbi:TatD family hydrolase, partial [Methylophilaceae bacterium]|nr:TatD family hydrolase [Methylophilaceae bacterium]
DRFRTHIRAAIKSKLPLIIHTRNAQDDTINIMKEEGANSATGVMHCFTESYEMAKKAIDLGFYISFSGIITFKNAETLRETVKKIPIENILIETDSPYLAPVPNRGKLNEPANVKYVAAQIAELKNISIEEVAEITTNNFFTLFSKCKKL